MYISFYICVHFNFAIIEFDNYFIQELNLAGYNSILDVSNDLDKAVDLVKLHPSYSRFSKLGVTRIALRIVNPNYILMVNADGSRSKFINSSEIERIRKLV